LGYSEEEELAGKCLLPTTPGAGVRRPLLGRHWPFPHMGAPHLRGIC
jgi:hypothetical protein